MRTVIRGVACLGAMSVLSPGTVGGQAAGTTVVIEETTVVDVRTGGLRPATTVLVRDGRITAIGSKREVPVPHNARIIDGRNRFLIPGLIDTHVHLFPPWYRNWPDTAAQLGWIVAGGVTTVRDALGAGLERNYLNLRNAVARGDIQGPRLVLSGIIARVRAITGASSDSLALTHFREFGLDQVKIRGLPREAALAAIRRAREARIAVFGHVGRPIDDTTHESYAMAAVQAGISGISHFTGGHADGQRVVPEYAGISYQSSFDHLARSEVARQAGHLATPAAWLRSLIDTMVARGTWLEPTLVVGIHGNEALAGHCASRHDPEAIMRYYPFESAQWATHPPARADSVRRICRAKFDFVRQFYEAGGIIVTGTDYPPFPPLGTTEEMRLLVLAGLPPLAALQAATINAARALELADDIGTVEVGKIADLVLLDGNPLADIANSRRIAAVLAGGRLIDRERLLARAGTSPPMVSYDDQLDRIEDRLRTLAFERPDSVVTVLIRTDGTERPEDHRGFGRDGGVQILSIDGNILRARGPAFAARIISRVRFVVHIGLEPSERNESRRPRP